MKRIAYIGIISYALFLTSGIGAIKSSSAAIDKQQVYASKAIANALTYTHYSKTNFGDRLSSEFFDNYIETLDPRHQTLLQSDLKHFEQYRTRLDNDIKQGNLEFGQRLFDVYKSRMNDNLDMTLKDWPSYIRALDFTKKESIEIDRSKQDRPKTLQESRDLWRKHIKSTVLNMKLKDKSDADIEKILKKRLTSQKKNLNKKNNSDVFQIYMNALTELYDPHTNFLSPRLSENFNINMSLKLQGIGAVLQNKDEDVTIVRLIPGGPADKNGELKPNDRVIAVGQGTSGEMVDVVGWQLDDVVELIRGKPKSTVRLEINRGSGSVERSRMITIVRDTVKLEDQSAKKAVLEIQENTDPDGKTSKIGVIKIPAFYMDFDAYRRGDKNFKSTTRDVKKLLEELDTESVDGVIIDLRENGGGSLYEAEELTSLFIEEGLVVQIRHSNNSVSYEGKRFKSDYYKGPIAILINRLSASASEIFAAAIQDYQRGIIIGTQSYGKGTVQSIKELPYGDLKITESKFYRVSGESTQHRGVIPDIELPAVYDKDEIGEDTDEHALEWDKIPAAPYARYFNFKQISPNLIAASKKRISTDPDFMYQKSLEAMSEKDEKFISLNLDERQKEKIDKEAKIIKLENHRRKAKGLATVSTIEEIEDEKAEQSNETIIDTKDDHYLLEAAQILLDSNQLINKQCQANLTSKDCQHPIISTLMSQLKPKPGSSTTTIN